MRVTPVAAPSLGELRRWLWPADLTFADSGHHESPLPRPVGIVGESGWVIFHRLQVLLEVPDEVHSGWHRGLIADVDSLNTAWLVEGSDWIQTFDPKHLGRCSHYVVEHWDFVLEVICENLLYAASPVFDLERAIELHSCLADAYFWRALQAEKRGDVTMAREDLQRVLAADGAFFRNSAYEHLRRLGAVQKS